MATKDFSPESLSQRRLKAVRLRLDGQTVAEACRQTGLSAPTVSAAWKAFREGGWEAVPLRPRGRPAGQANALGEPQQQALEKQLAALPPAPLPAWSSKALAEWLQVQPTPLGVAVSARAIEHWWDARGLAPVPLALDGLARRRSAAGRWYRQQVQPSLESVERADGVRWLGGVRVVPARPNHPRCYQLYLHGKRGALFMHCLAAPPQAEHYLALFERLLQQADGPIALVFHGAWFQASPEIRAWLEEHPDFHLINVPPDALGAESKRRNV
ncbi:helix-turn-helix domain-containing protein [Billgrantia diversa]|uniref:helix-turn-helix domain-containing protein n=1 Tax=Halomonas sp. MCCC 1A13316 TaxID=2733487 RepID=UPI0018A5E3B6|nr:helix-turn-helix domain-containing protein [Halomonas sp. MCCC 1A13316]QOR37439.1 helix-turn-helix domain-containing protein [Halomonas sp. MCCC 1A13316]